LIDNTNHFDLVFTGWGASTCILLIEMEKISLLENKNILIIEPSDKLENDKITKNMKIFYERIGFYI